jgi:hypothetical protein
LELVVFLEVALLGNARSGLSFLASADARELRDSAPARPVLDQLAVLVGIEPMFLWPLAIRLAVVPDA